jgi:ubiquinone/menaquinone biosynthesis C-methylase UbiE
MSENNNPFEERWKKELSSKLAGNGSVDVAPTEARLEFEREQIEILKSLLSVKKGDSVLEFGSGKARVLKEIGMVAESCTGLDISLEVLKLNKLNKLNGEEIPFVQGNMFSQPFKEGSFDLVLSEGVIEHFDNWRKILSEANRILKPGGKLVTAVPNLLNLPQTIALTLQGKNFRYYPEKPFYPGMSGSLAKEYKKMGLTNLQFAGWKPGYFLDSFYLFDPKTGNIKQPFYSPILRALGKSVESFMKVLPDDKRRLVNRWLGYEFVIVGTKPSDDDLVPDPPAPPSVKIQI